MDIKDLIDRKILSIDVVKSWEQIDERTEEVIIRIEWWYMLKLGYRVKYADDASLDIDLTWIK